MKRKTITSFSSFLNYVESLELTRIDIILFRGQSGNDALLPSIARSNSGLNTTEVEKDMLAEFRRRSYLLINREIKSDWDLLVYAQHFGLKTRLLDWSSNPLVALWFACQNEHKLDKDSYVYILEGDKSMMVDIDKDKSPFTNDKTKILRPVLNSERILAQSGWFTAHRYSNKAKKFVQLESNKELKTAITRLKIPSKIKLDVLKKLAIFGNNNRTIFPDIHGLCAHMNWNYRDALK
jgi:hypothetical protein